MLINRLHGYPICFFSLMLCFGWIPIAHSSESLNDASSIRVKVTNPLDLERPRETVELDWGQLTEALPQLQNSAVRIQDGQTGLERICQTIDCDADGKIDQLIFKFDFGPKQSRTFIIRAAPTVRTVYEPSPVHARFVPTRVDDMAWENDRMAFRTYGPACGEETGLVSNGIDVWMKRVRYPIIEKWYSGGGDFYHHDRGEGADLFKVGDTLGCGATAIWKEGRFHAAGNFARWRLLANGPVRLLFELEYDSWKVGDIQVRETRRFSLDAGHNLTRMDAIFHTEPPQEQIEFVAGLVHREGSQPTGNAERAWIGLWGPVDPNRDHGELGTGVVMGRCRFRKVIQQNNHSLILAEATPDEPAPYWAGAGWTKSGDFDNVEQWNEYLDHWARRVAAPLDVAILN